MHRPLLSNMFVHVHCKGTTRVINTAVFPKCSQTQSHIEISCSFLLQFPKDDVSLHAGSFFIRPGYLQLYQLQCKCVSSKFVPTVTCYTNSNGTCDYYSCVSNCTTEIWKQHQGDFTSFHIGKSEVCLHVSEVFILCGAIA